MTEERYHGVEFVEETDPPWKNTFINPNQYVTRDKVYVNGFTSPQGYEYRLYKIKINDPFNGLEIYNEAEVPSVEMVRKLIFENVPYDWYNGYFFWYLRQPKEGEG